jgi:DNA-binding NarL/FixJ family response regulator
MRLMLVDDHPVVRTALATMLRHEADIDIFGEAGDGKLAVEMTRELLPDVVLMDVNLPAMDGVGAARVIPPEYPTVRVGGLSMHDDVEQAKAMLKAGASGYVCKSDEPEVLLAVIRGCGKA